MGYNSNEPDMYMLAEQRQQEIEAVKARALCDQTTQAREKLLPATLSGLHGRINTLYQLVRALESTLGPVSSSNSPQKDMAIKEEDPYAYYDRISYENDRLERILEDLERILNNLEV